MCLLHLRVLDAIIAMTMTIWGRTVQILRFVLPKEIIMTLFHKLMSHLILIFHHDRLIMMPPFITHMAIRKRIELEPQMELKPKSRGHRDTHIKLYSGSMLHFIMFFYVSLLTRNLIIVSRLEGMVMHVIWRTTSV